MSTCWYSFRFSRSFLISGASLPFFSLSSCVMSFTIDEISSSVRSFAWSTCVCVRACVRARARVCRDGERDDDTSRVAAREERARRHRDADAVGAWRRRRRRAVGRARSEASAGGRPHTSAVASDAFSSLSCTPR